jgi:hypothetical protein
MFVLHSLKPGLPPPQLWFGVWTAVLDSNLKLFQYFDFVA